MVEVHRLNVGDSNILQTVMGLYRESTFPVAPWWRSLRPMKPLLLLLLVSLLAADLTACDAQTPARKSTASSETAVSANCIGLEAHWRRVWAAEERPGFERRGRQGADLAIAVWKRRCAEVTAQSLSALELEQIRAVRSWAALKVIDATTKGGVSVLIKTAKDSAEKTEAALRAAPASGVVECEDAIVAAAFCGDAVDRAAVRSAAKGKDDGACAALGVLLSKKCGD